MPVVSSETAVSDEAAVVVSTPPLVSIRIWSATPAAAPPGTTRLNALPASWLVTTGNHSVVRRTMVWSHQMQTKLRSCAPKMATNHDGLIVTNVSQDE